MRYELTRHLHFRDREIERDFRARDNLASVRPARFCYLSGSALWAGFGLVDVLVASEHLQALWAIRFGIGLPTLALALIATYVTSLQKGLKTIGFLVTIICGSSIIAMVAVLDAPASDLYYVGLILVLFYSYILAQLSFLQAAISGSFLFLFYEIILFNKSSNMDVLVNNTSFVISTIYIGLFACRTLETHRRTDYARRRTIADVNRRLSELTVQLSHLSSHDDLTGLLNRRRLQTAFTEATNRIEVLREATAVMLIDVDDFKQVNDQYGHDVGDEVLEQVGDAIRRNVRAEDTAFRYGGDEFLILLPGRSAVGSAATATRIAAAFREWAGAAAMPAGTGVGVSIGVTEVVSSLDTLRYVMQLADAAMYEAKRRGKGRIVIQPRSRDAAPEPRSEARDPHHLSLAGREGKPLGGHTHRRRRRL
ncbi:MAG TPA: GGDEF domain-containing protein [Thermoanaerobaculales bacterium]|nr:GGDEF domain-containing protein [Thermoanaerobaculales bacterium]HQL29169.1 GGDEF domain-containing protein [Thermoanaerobaculales bacterium]HQN97515.1 GGDEF domain-containing protein [Thermoanaerobaculales bacterium]